MKLLLLVTLLSATLSYAAPTSTTICGPDEAIILLSNNTTKTIKKADLKAQIPNLTFLPSTNSTPPFITSASNHRNNTTTKRSSSTNLIIPLEPQTFLGWDIAMSTITHANEAPVTLAIQSGQMIANSVTTGVSSDVNLIEDFLSLTTSISYQHTTTSTITGTVTMTIPKGKWGAIVSNPLTHRSRGYVFNGEPGNGGTFEYYQADSYEDTSYTYGEDRQLGFLYIPTAARACRNSQKMSWLIDTVNEKGDRSIRPPQLSLILRDNNVLQLEEQQIQDALEKSREYWYQIANLAFQLRDTATRAKNIRTDPITWVSSLLDGAMSYLHGSLRCEVENSSMQYTSFQTEYSDESLPNVSQVHVVDIGEVDESVARWWSALLALNEGWKATVKQTPQGDFLAPWSVSRTCETQFSIKYKDSPSSNHDLMPLSSRSAFEALLEFARLHGLQSQFLIALTMALIIPTHKYYKQSAKLPLPQASAATLIDTPTDAEWVKLKEDLPHYMTLSCSPEVMMSTFCGAFWEHDVPCKLVSPWLHPIINEVLGALPENELEVLAFIGAIRQPCFSAFWIGAVASGLGPQILHRRFLDFAGSGPYTYEDRNYILREDVWRLTHYPSTEEDNEGYQHGPRVPWAPCGASLTKDCALYVTAHVDCPRHEYKYDYWEWYLPDGTTMQDRGFSEQVTAAVSEGRFDNIQLKTRRDFRRTKMDQEASREASGQVFLWYFFGGEGLPSESIYQEEWLKEIWENNMSEFGGGEFDDRELPEPVVKSGECVDSWLNTVG
ncbi:hypothetical protein M752DRAFT_326235 [Aspergillus phoenicis ATCC 13157]|uniref:Ig-like domain-containing protein n=1 Tax=Aspergillus phoenicis ATCC 13157 TaxID=1353007 RepID=A0A370PNC1_ASPPH|nr:hypothetical protein M752DRAFT_326235 [Aspergillus phoenicis ATCC 13157]